MLSSSVIYRPGASWHTTAWLGFGHSLKFRYQGETTHVQQMLAYRLMCVTDFLVMFSQGLKRSSTAHKTNRSRSRSTRVAIIATFTFWAGDDGRSVDWSTWRRSRRKRLPDARWLYRIYRLNYITIRLWFTESERASQLKIHNQNALPDAIEATMRFGKKCTECKSKLLARQPYYSVTVVSLITLPFLPE